MIKLTHVNKHYGNHHVLKDINLEIQAGEKVVIIGPSGSGKSTLIRTMNRLETVSDGSIAINGIDITKKKAPINEIRTSIQMVFQNFNLYAHKTVLENLTLAPIKVKGVKKEDAEESAKMYLKRIGLLHKADVYPHQLSGGQQQRVAIARALNMHPDAILFDEPTSALDPEMIQEVLDVMEDLSDLNMTMVVVTHEMGFARKVADKIVFMADGKIEAQACPEEFFTQDQGQRVTDFLGKIIAK